jgi:aspartate aminotransferase, cytoplasmic
MPSQSSPSTPTSRLNAISNHIMGSASSPWAFTADLVPQAAEDPLFGLMAAYRRDTSPQKVDLGIGAYRDNNAKPWVLPVVKKVGLALPEPNNLRHMLTPSTGR